MTTCLVVDDSALIRKLAIKMLTNLGVETREAANGAEALTSCTSAMPDVVLLDWNMPVLDGMGFLRKLRSMTGVVQPKVLLCTTENEFEKIAQALEMGADEFIMKPFDEEILESKLRLIGAI